MGKPNVILDKRGVERILHRIAHEIVERNRGVEGLVIVGIRARGDILAKRIADTISEIEGSEIPLGVLDITLYRDDIALSQAQVRKTDIPFSIEGKTIVLVDDVLYTGRTIRAALDALMDYGRPSCIQLAILIDRGHRELPIRPDFVGKNVPTSRTQEIDLTLEEEGKEDTVLLVEKKEKK